MPLYEYRCEPCNQTFETLVRRPEDKPFCPQCGGDEVAKQFSVPAAAQTNGSSALPICSPAPRPMMGGCGTGGCGSGMCSMN